LGIFNLTVIGPTIGGPYTQSEPGRDSMTAARLTAFSLTACVLSTAALAAAPGYHLSERIPGPDGSWDYVRVDPANNRVLVAQGTSVMAVDLASKAVTPGLAPGRRLHDAMPVNDGREMLVTNGGTGTAVFADARSGAIVATAQAGKNPDAAAFDARSGLILVMNPSGGDITLIEAKTHKVSGTVDVGGDLEAAAVDGAGHAFVNVEDKNQIAVVDLAARKVTARYALIGCEGPTGLAYDAADRLLIAACDGRRSSSTPRPARCCRPWRPVKARTGSPSIQGASSPSSQRGRPGRWR
jgi:DNA-binding beta-propeller fold protein YncE